MSHICSVDTAFKDIDSLRKACNDLRVEFDVEGKQFRRHGGKTKCDHLIKVPGADYDVGVVKAKDSNEFSLKMDTWGPGSEIEKKLGRGCGLLQQRYNYHVTKNEMQRKGYRCRDKQMADGVVRVFATK